MVSSNGNNMEIYKHLRQMVPSKTSTSWCLVCSLVFWHFYILASTVFVILDVPCQVLYWGMLPYLNILSAVLCFLITKVLFLKQLFYVHLKAKSKPKIHSLVIILFVRGTVEKGRKLPLRTVFEEGFSDSSSKTGLVGDLVCLWMLLIEKGKSQLPLGSSEVRPMDFSHPETSLFAISQPSGLPAIWMRGMRMGDFPERNVISCQVLVFLRKQCHPWFGVERLRTSTWNESAEPSCGIYWEKSMVASSPPSPTPSPLCRGGSTSSCSHKGYLLVLWWPWALQSSAMWVKVGPGSFQ